MANRTRNIVLRVPVTPEERALIQQKMAQLHTKNFSAYARKMLIDGYIVHMDTSDIRAQTAELQKIGVNVNQIARRIPRMNYPQYRKARKLTHECCNYCDGNCLLLDDGEECVCVQSISYSLLCRWFRAAVLPLDGALYAEIIQSRDSVKRCAVCGAAFTPKSNRAKYCPDCAVRMRRKQEAERQRKRYLQATQLSR